MRPGWWWLAALLVAFGCEERADEVDEPEAVAPVEVTAEDTPADPATSPTTAPTAEGATDVAALQARIAELESQLASCRGGDTTAGTTTQQGGTQVAAVPEGVDVPAGESAPSTAGTTRSSSGSSGSSSSGRRSSNDDPATPGGLLGALLGDGNGSSGSNGSSGRRRRSSDDGTNGQNTLPNPVDVLLGPGGQ
ncbi:MAG: hypothetical protein R3B82_07950 [Sandaracinaceae bacterium]